MDSILWSEPHTAGTATPTVATPRPVPDQAAGTGRPDADGVASTVGW